MGSGNPADITSATLLQNGTPVIAAAFTYTTATFNLSQTLLATPVTYTVQVNFSTAASGNYTFSLSGASGSNGQAVLFSGLPVSGATVTVSAATATPTNTATASPSSTSTLTFTGTSTPTITSIATATNTFTGTATPSPTPSKTPTVPAQGPVVIYPNPVTGDTVTLSPGHSSASGVKVSYFTLAFRRVNELHFPSVPAGGTVTLPLVDEGGTPLANGLYYIVVQTDQGRSLLKLLVIR
jgi:hypothetical protein